MAYAESTVLPILKSRLNRLPTDTTLDPDLRIRIEAANEELGKKGVHLSEDSAADQVLLADYTAWRYQSRDKPGGQPEWLRLAMRERWLADKGVQDAT